MDIASLINYPMLPKYEKVIPKPPKKRYRDLFEHGEAITNIENIPVKKQMYNQIAVNDENTPVCHLQPLCKTSTGGNSHRKSSTKHSLRQRISIEISPFASNTNNKYDAVLPSGSELINHYPHRRFLSTQNYLVNSSSMKFVGKLKVKWLEEYKNYEDKDAKEDSTLSSLSVNQLKSKEEPMANDNTSIINTVETTSLHPTTHKLERARKGLIYQKFMASTYLKSRRRNNMRVSSNQQPKKRGRPKTITTKSKECTEQPSNSKASITLVRLEGAESEGLKYTVKKSLPIESKLKSECRLCGESTRVGSKISFAKSDRKTCRCYITTGANNIEIIINELQSPIPAKHKISRINE